ncbi:hypothetical protein GCM10010109_19350 [Actinoplanes campanulatus]|nr:hypothetical protein GCM10010109_19350 [Actinoplanes campanulatus]GID36453.1 hypothetical protein Aca09nite_29590 [Actinoplanes campanulatus]
MSKWRSGSACPGTDLRPAGAAKAGAGSEIAPTGRDGPDKAGARTRVPQKERHADLDQE